MQFDVALSFAGEDRAYVENVAFWLLKMGYRIFYDKYETISIWGKNLYDYLIDIYQKKAQYTVIFGSKHYKKKIWATHERRAAQAKALKSTKDYILPARFDNTVIPGILSTIAYINLKDYAPKEFAFLIKEKIGRVPKKMFCPEEPDLLYKKLSATSAEKKEIVFIGVNHFMKTLRLMTIEERRLLEKAILNTCPAGPLKNNVHLNIDYFSRMVKLTPDEIVSKFARLDCLGIRAEVKKEPDRAGVNCKIESVLYIRYRPLAENCPDNITYVMINVFELLHELLCPHCRIDALKYIDFSFLSSVAGFPDKQDTLEHKRIVKQRKS